MSLLFVGMAVNVVAGVLLVPPPLLCLVDNQLAKVDSKLEQMLPGVTSFSDPFVHI